jgi:hypothetical protein
MLSKISDILYLQCDTLEDLINRSGAVVIYFPKIFRILPKLKFETSQAKIILLNISGVLHKLKGYFPNI